MPKLTRTIKISEDTWKDAKKLAIDKDTNLSVLIEELLTKELKKKVKE
ncbi:hypothetical protein JXB27_02525 [Candidatus Woesearchaeota archaeon]|nr:hypothetical protein [Candidatus Woesearchaeota archaeon]